MSNPTLQLGGGKWATKQGNILAYAQGDNTNKVMPRELGFSRAADLAATRVNKDGLIEKGRENKFTYSNNFASSGPWGHHGLANFKSKDSAYPQPQEGYDGTMNGALITASVGNETSHHRLQRDNPSFNGTQTISIHVKKSGIYDFFAITTNFQSRDVYFNLANGTVASEGSDVISSQITPVGNGWYRVSSTIDMNLTAIRFNICKESGSTQFIGDGVSGVLIQDAQWQVGLVPTEYMHSETTTTGKAGISEDLPRIDYTNGSPRLIMEPSRTNLVTDSEGNISQMGGAATRTYKPNEVNPTGYKGGVVELSNLLGADGDRWQVVVDIADSLPSTAKTWTGSMYIKGTSGEKIDYQIKRNGNGEFEGSGLETITFDGTWQRITATFTNDTDNDQAGIFLTNRASTTADKVLIWGRQIEEGPNATSYIPTYGSTDTRVIDQVTDLDMTKLDLGTTCSVYWEGVIHEATDTYVRPVTTFASHSSQSTDNRFLLFGSSFSGSTYTLTSRFNSGGITYGVDKTGLTIGDKIKCLTVIDGTSQKFYVNGTLAGSDTIPATAVFNSLDLSNVPADINYTVDDIRFYPTAIDQSEAEDLTTI